MTAYQVVKAAAVITGSDGAQHMLYERAIFDDANYNAEHVKMLLDEGFIEKAEVADEAAVDEPAGEPVEPTVVEPTTEPVVEPAAKRAAAKRS